MAVFKRGGVWWYKFYFAGQFIRESTKSTSKTVAENAENQRRRELEQAYHNLRRSRENRIRQRLPCGCSVSWWFRYSRGPVDAAWS